MDYGFGFLGKTIYLFHKFLPSSSFVFGLYHLRFLYLSLPTRILSPLVTPILQVCCRLQQECTNMCSFLLFSQLQQENIQPQKEESQQTFCCLYLHPKHALDLSHTVHTLPLTLIAHPNTCDYYNISTLLKRKLEEWTPRISRSSSSQKLL